MAQLTLTILGNLDDVTNKVNAIKKDLEQNPISIKITAAGAEASIKKLASALEKLPSKMDGMASGLRATQEQADKVVKVFKDGDLSKTVQDFTTGIGKTKQVITEVGKEGDKVTEKFTTNFKAQRKYMEEADAAYAAYKKELADTAPDTAMQKQINTITGVGRSFKSAEESARVFMQNGLTPVEKQMNTATVQAGLLNKNYGELVDSQRVWSEDGTMLIKGVDTYRDAVGNVTKVTSELSGTTAKVTVAQRTGTEQMKKYSDSANGAAKASSKLLKSLNQYVSWYLRWTLISNMFQAITRSIRDAIKTMREVDDELVTIRKVTGFSNSQIESIRQQAYTTASAYGVGAADYLSSVAAFSRAGYKEQSAALAELSTKTQIVGDTTEEVANQFLLSVDAAYQYKGSIEKLSKVLDGANELDNKYATSIEKIAEGMGIVAPVAAQVHVDIDELAAAIGTITAVTQRSGSEAARALRALFLNIVGDTKTEIDEGVTWTTGEIAGLKDVIKQFAPEAYKLAEAEKRVIDPMEAIGGLAKSMKEGLLNEQQLMAMVSDIGGKLRTSQLLAIIQNWDTYQSMLVDYGNALGSADKEVANALDSWTRKTEILKNTFAEFISHLVDTKQIKGILDALTSAIKAVDTESGRTALTIGAVALTITTLTKNIPALISTLTGGGGIVAGIKALVTAIGSATTATEVFSAVWKASPFFIAAAAVSAIYGIYKLIDYLDVTADEHLEKSQKAREEAQSLESDLQELNDKIAENEQLISDADKASGNHTAYITKLKTENELLEEQIALQKKNADEAKRKASEEAIASLTTKSEKYQVGTNERYSRTVYDGTTAYAVWEEGKRSGTILEYVNYLLRLARAGEDVSGKLLEVVPTLRKLNDALDVSTEDGELWSRAIATATTYINAYLDTIEPVTASINSLSEVQGNAVNQTNQLSIALKDQVAIYNELKEKLTPLTAALSEMNEKGYMTESTMQALIAAYPNLQSAIEVTNEGFTINTALLRDNISALSASYEVIYNNAVSAAETLLSAEARKRAGIDATTMSIRDQLMALAKLYASDVKMARLTGDPKYWDYVDLLNTTMDAWHSINLSQKNLDTANAMLGGFAGATGTPEKDSTKSSGGGGSSASKETDTVLENIQERIKLLKSELSIMEERGDATGDIVAKQREIQAALHEEAEHLRSVKDRWSEIGVSQTDVNALSLEWLQIQNKIKKALEDQQKAIEDIRKDAAKQAQEDALSMLEAEENNATAALQEQLDLLKSQKDTIEDSREEEEKLLAVEQARIALENAQKERNIRQYNAATGQWEWVANAETVQKAQEDLQKAQDSLADYYRNRSISALEANIKSIQDQYSALRSAIKDFAEKIENGTAKFGEALAYLTAAVGGGLGGVLGQVAGVFGTSGSSVSDSVIAQMKSNSAAWSAASGDAATQQALADANLALGTSQGWYRGTDGRWYYPDGTPVYDSGGVLHGIGGIKATRRDEIILPPDISDSLLKAERYGSFDALLGHLGIVTAAANSFAGFGSGTVNRNSIGSQHNGDVFEMGGVTIGEAQARGMTVFDFAQMAKTLALHRGS